jgi:hypothetical protein
MVGSKVVHLVQVVDTIPFSQVVVINLEVVEAVTILEVCIHREAVVIHREVIMVGTHAHPECPA